MVDEANNLIYETRFKLPETPGFVSLTIPETAAPIEIEKWYEWLFILDCSPNEELNVPITSGWVRRIARTPDLDRQLEAAQPREDQIYAANQIYPANFATLEKIALLNCSRHYCQSP